LERKLTKLRTREAETREELSELKQMQDNAKMDKDQKILSLEAENAEMQDRLALVSTKLFINRPYLSGILTVFT